MTRMPTIQAFQAAAANPAKPNTHGDTNNHTPSTMLTDSGILELGIANPNRAITAMATPRSQEF